MCAWYVATLALGNDPAVFVGNVRPVPIVLCCVNPISWRVCGHVFRFVYGCVRVARRNASASEIPPSFPFDTAIASAKAVSVIVMQRVGFMDRVARDGTLRV